MPVISSNTLRLLKQQEIRELYSLPQLEERERDLVFALSSREREVFLGLHTLPSKILFILQLGFFRIGKRFYPLDELATDKESKACIITRYFPGHCHEDISLQITKPTRLSHQTQILELFNYRRYGGDAVAITEKEAIRLAGIHSRPSYIVRELLRFLERECIITPAYSTLQNLVGMAVQGETTRLEARADKLITDEEKEKLSTQN